jgi:hypothetical protein
MLGDRQGQRLFVEAVLAVSCLPEAEFDSAYDLCASIALTSRRCSA